MSSFRHSSLDEPAPRAPRAEGADGARGGPPSAPSRSMRRGSESRCGQVLFHVRSAAPRDGRALAALMDSVYAEERWFVGDGAPSGEAMARRLRGLHPEQEMYLVAEAAGQHARLYGWIELHRYLPSRLAHVASLTIAVAAPVRGRGIGRTLMRAVLPWCARVGVRKIRLDVRAGNEAAIALYRSEGFRVEGVERDQIRLGDGFEDNVLMARFVAP